MTPGPDQVIACPNCGALEQHGTIVAGNTGRRVSWSDLKVVSPFLRQPPKFVICHACHSCYWLADAPGVGLMPGPFNDPADWPRVNPAWRMAPVVAEPEEAQYYAFLSADLPDDRDQQFHLRLLAFQRRNDSFRSDLTIDDPKPDPVTGEAILSGDAHANVSSLLGLMDPNDSQLLFLSAELHRALGEFDIARDLFQRTTALPDLKVWASKLATLSEKQIATVRKLT